MRGDVMKTKSTPGKNVLSASNFQQITMKLIKSFRLSGGYRRKL